MTASPSASPVLWAEITDGDSQAARFQFLSEFLARETGVVNTCESRRIESAALMSTVLDLQEKGFRLVRVGGALPEQLLSVFENRSAQMLTLRCADTLALDENGRWWPGNVLQEGVLRVLASDLKGLDLSGAAFVIGATPEARSCVAALVRVGFRRVNLTDENEGRGLELIEEFRRAYFNVQFQFVKRESVTQLPGIHSIAVNTTHLPEGDVVGNDFFYFNFLRTGGFWVEVPFAAGNRELLAEAKSAGAWVETGATLAARCDQAWVEASFGLSFDACQYRAELRDRF